MMGIRVGARPSNLGRPTRSGPSRDICYSGGSGHLHTHPAHARVHYFPSSHTHPPMCLTRAWFEERALRMDRLAHKEGATDLQVFMTACDYHWEDLVAAGLLEPKPFRSTAHLFRHTPTAKGRQWLRAMKSYDILMVKKGMGPAIIDAVRAAAK